MALQTDIESYVSEALEELEYFPAKIRDKKIIRDSSFGLANFFEHEINVIDTPIIQRLRKIHQTGVAFLVYPSASHNRFEHSLGFTIIADKYASILQRKNESKFINPNDIIELRLAGILHDCGHGPFSHLSEDIYEHFPEVKDASLKNKFSKSVDSPHEIISYMIVKSSAFKDFFEEKVLKKFKYLGVNPDLDNIADMIVGKIKDPDREGYKADIIHGPFDADKLDYMTRDALFTGINMTVDVDRIIQTSSIDIRPGHERRLAFDIGGLHSLEQILFNKMFLFNSIYHHHKIRACECMMKTIFEIINDYPEESGNMSFKSALDFLRTNDERILSIETKRDSLLYKHIRRINNRELLKKAIVISSKTIESSSPVDFEDLIKIGEDHGMIRLLRELISERLGSDCDVYDIWVDLPKPPPFSEIPHTMIKLTNEEYMMMDEEDEKFHMHTWLQAYQKTRWRGHVFCPPYEDIQRKRVGEIATEVLFEVYELKLNDKASKFAKYAEY